MRFLTTASLLSSCWLVDEIQSGAVTAETLPETGQDLASRRRQKVLMLRHHISGKKKRDLFDLDEANDFDDKSQLLNVIQPSTVEISSKECDPDVGLLACGFGEYCLASSDSPLRGFCVPNITHNRVNHHRRMQAAKPVFRDFCDSESSGVCDCAAWTGTSGTIVCQIEEDYCIDGCSDVCYNSEYIYNSDGASRTLQYCIEVVSPVTQRFCYEENFEVGSCALSLDGDDCSSCAFSSRELCDDETGECSVEKCVAYDCRSIGLGAGDSCDGAEAFLYPPAFDACLDLTRGSNLSSSPPAEYRTVWLGALAFFLAYASS